MIDPTDPTAGNDADGVSAKRVTLHGRRALLLGLIGAGGVLAGCGRKPSTLLPPGGEEDADGFPSRYPSS